MYRVGRARLEEGRARRLNWWEFDTPQKREESNPNSGRWLVFQPPRPLLLVHFILLNTSAPFSKEIFFSFSGIHFEVFIFHSNFRFLYFSIDSLSLLPREKKNLKKWLDCFNVAYCGLFGGRQG
jgi:hypothetical protein